MTAALNKTKDEHLAAINELNAQIETSHSDIEQGSLLYEIGLEYYYMFLKAHPEKKDKMEYLTHSFLSFSKSKAKGSSAAAITMAEIVKNHRAYFHGKDFDGNNLDLDFCRRNYLEALDIMLNSEKGISNEGFIHPRWQIDAIISGLKEVHGLTGQQGDFFSSLKELSKKYENSFVGRQLQEAIKNYSYNRIERKIQD